MTYASSSGYAQFSSLPLPFVGVVPLIGRNRDENARECIGQHEGMLITSASVERSIGLKQNFVYGLRRRRSQHAQLLGPLHPRQRPAALPTLLRHNDKGLQAMLGVPHRPVKATLALLLQNARPPRQTTRIDHEHEWTGLA